ncbi:MAG: cytochrome c3 family protein [Nitrospiraceae bacterium]|nr:MAG: cytochrome c3 family protein [Nitrospiraceae bacterium]
MKRILIVLFGLLCVYADLSDGAPGQRHEFNQDECVSCHMDEKNDPEKIKPAVTDSCLRCHMDFNATYSHPTDRYPYKSTDIPEDMPLMDGKLTCLTCHYVHPRKNITNDIFIRRSSEEIIYCAICHTNDKREHTAVGKAHVKNDIRMNTSMDILSKLCLECHNRKISRGAPIGSLRICVSKVNHPVGISYTYKASRTTGEYRSESALHPKLILYDGKIGCGTCHNIYSQVRYLLVMNNDKSRLCLECHIK